MKIVKKKLVKLSKYINIIENTVRVDSSLEKYHSFGQSDYVSVLAISKKNKVILVRQFSPALKKSTIELPGGLRDKKEKHSIAAKRELYEETGYIAKKLTFLGSFYPDSGRLENKIYCYFADDIKFDKNHIDEKHVQSFEVTVQELKKLIKKNKIQHFLHVGIIGLANIRGLVKI